MGDIEEFDNLGHIFKRELDDKGNLILVNNDFTKIPTGDIIEIEGSTTEVLPEYFLSTAVYDMTLTRVKKKCDKCPSQVSVILKPRETTFFICELCLYHTQAI